MTSERAARNALVAASFDRVYELDEQQRAAALDELDAAVREEVESLIAALDRHGPLLEAGRTGSLVDADPSSPLRRVGAYRLVRLIGRGGMGAVYEAERADAVFVKRVAVKLIREDITGWEIARRFARERAILAGLEHPNIARMLDGGTLEDGREYLVMELVDGLPITSDRASPAATIRDRLRLFLQACDAVQFAHQHLVVHGDLKPSNLLVTPDGRVKLVDFGIAKIIDDGSARTRDPLTVLGALTPAYASPEQWRGESLSIISDVYSLGVVLYELLTGERPFAIDGRTTQDVITAIEAGPRRPSAVLSTTSGADGTVDRRRGQPLVGELDTIILTALDASPNRRYPTVERLADDVRRHLDGRLVLAQPATRRYRFSKFMRRNRGTVAAAAALALAVLGGGIAATVQARRANQQRDVAERISGFLKQMLASPDGSWMNAGRADVRVADILDAAVAQADTGLRSDPAAEAMVRRTIGSAYRGLNRFADADRQLKLALALDLKRHAPDIPDLAEDYHDIGWELYVRGDWKGAGPYLREAGTRCLARRADTSAVCYGSIGDYASSMMIQGRAAAAESLYREALRRGKIRFKANDAPLSVVYSNLGVIADNRGGVSEAEAMFRLALGAWHTGPQPTERITFYHGLAWNQLLQGNFAETERLITDGGLSAVATHQENAVSTFLLWIDGAAMRRRQGDPAGARDFLARARKATPPNVVPSHPLLTALPFEIGLELLTAGDPAKAEAMLLDVERIRSAVYPPTDARVARVAGFIGVADAAQAKYDEADTRLRSAAAALDSVYSPRYPLAREMRDALACADSARDAHESPAQATARITRFMAGRP